MRKFFIALLLPLLLVIAQQGAALHALSHIHPVSSTQAWTQTESAAEKTCELCLEFSQLGNPVSASLYILALGSVPIESLSDPKYSIIAAGIPTPRSRGPPALL